MSIAVIIVTTLLALLILVGIVVCWGEEIWLRNHGYFKAAREEREKRLSLIGALVCILLAGLSLVWSFHCIERVETPESPSVTP